MTGWQRSRISKCVSGRVRNGLRNGVPPVALHTNDAPPMTRTLHLHPSRYCSKDDGNDWLGLDACAVGCSTCGCSDSDSWYRAGKPSKDCSYVAKKPSKYCDYEGEDGTFAYDSCPKACGKCGCQDDATWAYKGKSKKDCDWVAKKPDKYW